MDCPSLVDLGYEAFSQAINHKANLGRVPLVGSFEVTSRCNLKCVHCYLPVSERGGSSQAELSLPEIRRIFSEMADLGCLWLLLTGGEPFARRDFLQIYDDAKRKGFITTIFTNGTLLDERIADHLAEWRPFSVEISLYGATQATYENVTGIPGSFYRCMRAIELLLERKIPLKLKTVLITLNQHELEAMQALAESLGLQFRFDPVINAGIDGSQRPVQYRLRPAEIVEIEKNDPIRAAGWPQAYEKKADLDIDYKRVFSCGAGVSSFHIDAAGKMSVCLVARSPSFDLLHGSFDEGWNHFLKEVLSIESDPSFICSSCELRAACPQCPGLAYVEFGKSQTRIPFLCELAHLRRDAFASQSHQQPVYPFIKQN